MRTLANALSIAGLVLGLTSAGCDSADVMSESQYQAALGGGSPGDDTGGRSGEPDTGGPEPEGMCLNSEDIEVLQQRGDGLLGTANVCANGCTLKKDCIVGCMQDETDLSEGCSECFADAVICVVKECLSDCLPNPRAGGCLSCQKESGCLDDLEECGGVPATP